MTLYKADVSFLIDIEASDMETAVYMAKQAVPKHLDSFTSGKNGSGHAVYSGINAVKVEAVSKNPKEPK